MEADLQLPLALRIVPDSFGDLLLQLDVLHATVLFSHAFPVRVDLRRGSIECRPFFVWLKRSLIRMGWDVCEHCQRGAGQL